MNSSSNAIETVPPSAGPSGPSPTGTTRCFWYGYLIGGAAGAVLGYWMGDMIGWIYMTGTIGSVAALPFDRSGSES